MGRASQAVRLGWPRHQVLRNEKCKTNPPNIGLKFVGRISIKDERRKAAGRVGGSSKSQRQDLLNLASHQRHSLIRAIRKLYKTRMNMASGPISHIRTR